MRNVWRNVRQTDLRPGDIYTHESLLDGARATRYFLCLFRDPEGIVRCVPLPGMEHATFTDAWGLDNIVVWTGKGLPNGD